MEHIQEGFALDIEGETCKEIALVWNQDNARRMAMCWNEHEAVVQALTNMVKMWDFLKPAHDELFESKVDVTLSEARALLKRIQEQETQ